MSRREIFEAFKGEWNIKRFLRELGVIHGTATFTNSGSPDTLLYREDCHHNRLHSYKEYEYRYMNEKIIKYFRNDQVPSQIFYELNLISDKRAIGNHICALDQYAATYEFHSFNNFTLSYSVKGPAKDYFIQTEFNKISPLQKLMNL